MHAKDRASHALGIEVDEVEPGRARLRMRVTEDMANLHGIAHGGYLFLLADAAFAYACNGYGRPAVAHNAQIAFLRPAHVGDELTASATEQTRVGLQGLYNVTVRRGDEVVAEFRGHSQMLTSRHIGGSP